MKVTVAVKTELTELSVLKGKYKVATIRGMNRAAKPVKEEMIAQAAIVSTRTGYLPKSIGTKSGTYQSVGFTVVGPKRSFVRKGKRITRGPNKGQRSLIVPHKYGWLLVRGTRRTRQIDWMRPVWASVGRNFAARARQEIAIEFAKIGSASK